MMAFFAGLPQVAQALIATLFTWSVTAAGAAVVFLLRRPKKGFLDGMLGFAGGVMLAASYWSLLEPAIVMAESLDLSGWGTALIGFMSGGALLLAGDQLFQRANKNEQAASARKRSAMLIAAITLHNIPEGMAVGVAFGSLAYQLEGATLTAACLLALGLAALASVLVFLFAVYFPARSACPFILYTTLADALLLGALWDRGGKAGLRAAAALFCALALLILPLAAKDVLSVHRQSAARDAALRELAQTPGSSALVEPITPASKYPAVWPGDEDYFNNDIALYYGLAEYAVTEYVNH